MLLESGVIEVLGNAGRAETLVNVPLDVAVRASGLPQQAHFEDQEINAVLDMSRTGARVIILVTVLAAVGYWLYAMFVLMSSEGDSRGLERSREVIWNIVKGLMLGVCSYLIINGAVTLYINAGDLADVVRFWDDSEFAGEFNLNELLTSEIALEGEVLMLGGDGRPISCKDGLDDIARNAGWTWNGSGVGGTGVAGCVKAN